jgi:hypothetical protein
VEIVEEGYCVYRVGEVASRSVIAARTSAILFDVMGQV